MLFPYTYVPHQMEKMQEFIDFIFCNVWCKAPAGLEFTLELFDAKPDLKEVLSSFGFAHKAPARGKQFYKEIKDIYALFTPLNSSEIDQFKQWYKANNDVENICNNDPEAKLARYSDIAHLHNDLADHLAVFFKGLYSQSLLKLAALKDKIGDIDDHYNIAFEPSNSAGKCPFCGIADMKGADHKYREAYDHYLPKALYPFNSINLKNLAPACHECNSTYKNIKDPAHKGTVRRKAFYPYATAHRPIDIHIQLDTPDIANLKPADVNLTFGPADINEQIETWKDVYGIEERYKAKLCGKNDGQYWLIQIRDEWTTGGREPDEFLETLRRQAQSNPYAESNFLKEPFLDACRVVWRRYP